jgi:hypothetical protein
MSPARPLPKRNSGPTQTSRARQALPQHEARTLGGQAAELLVEAQQADLIDAEVEQPFDLGSRLATGAASGGPARRTRAAVARS